MDSEESEVEKLEEEEEIMEEEEEGEEQEEGRGDLNKKTFDKVRTMGFLSGSCHIAIKPRSFFTCFFPVQCTIGIPVCNVILIVMPLC